MKFTDEGGLVSQPLPEIQAMLKAGYSGEQPDPTAPLPEFRRNCDAGVTALHHLVREYGHLHAIRDLVADGVPVRLYLPRAETALPVHVHLHGGGWWMGSIATVDPMSRELAQCSGLAVVSVGYRLAPEHPYPAGLDDVCAVLRWLSAHPEELGFTPTTISVGGESAGANLAAAACVRLRDEGGPEIVAQWLDVPVVDLTTPPDESMANFSTGYGLELALLPLMRQWYCNVEQVHQPYVSPALAPDLAGLPPAIVTTAAFDPMRDQGERFAAALTAAGNEVLLRRAEGQVHAGGWLTALTPSIGASYDATIAALIARHEAFEVAR